MNLVDVCRVCLSGRRSLHSISNTVFQETWEKLTNAKFNTNDGKPLLVCYICCAQLRKSHQLKTRALEAEQLLTAIISNGSELSLNSVLLIASHNQAFDYNYSIKELYQFDNEQFKGGSEEYIKENDGGSEEDNEAENGFKLKEEKGGTPGRKHKLNEVPEKLNQIQIKLEQITEDESSSHSAVSESLPGNYCEASDSDHNIPESKQNIELIVHCPRVNETSQEVNIVPKNEKVENKATLNFEVCYNNADIAIFKQSTRTIDGAVAPGRHDERHETNISDRTKIKNEFSCRICQYRCVTKSSLNDHIRIHTGEKPYTCDLCDFRCAFSSGLNRHIKYKHTNEKNFSCNMCEYKCVEKRRLNIHMQKHTREKPYLCDLCTCTFSAKAILNKHMKDKHTNEKNFSCNICESKFFSKGDLDMHLRVHTGEKSYTCDLCDYTCSQEKALKGHIKRIHTKEKRFSCHLCEYKCFRKLDFNTHLRIHIGEKRFKCASCDYRCAKASELGYHIKTKHTNEKNFSCHICQSKFLLKSYLKVHLRKHTGEKPYTCSLCDRKFSQRSTLTSHIKYKHTNERNFPCHICQVKCVTKSKLIYHMRTHTGEKPYICDLCGYTCATKCRLNTHIMYKHTNEKNYTCHLCQYKCVERTHLNRHLRKHTEEQQ